MENKQLGFGPASADIELFGALLRAYVDAGKDHEFGFQPLGPGMVPTLTLPGKGSTISELTVTPPRPDAQIDFGLVCWESDSTTIGRVRKLVCANDRFGRGLAGDQPSCTAAVLSYLPFSTR